uniref:Ethanolamine-phosphate cytidylyltransferase n=1 Tax=Lygus hesperus TaxID=30085 RepID=A0A0A9W747_LYGHE
MNLNERVLGVLSCRYVDEVVMGVPYKVTKELINSLRIDVVVSGKNCDEIEDTSISSPYEAAINMSIFHEVDSGCTLTTNSLIERVLQNRVSFLKRQAEKHCKDKESEARKPETYKNIQEI